MTSHHNRPAAYLGALASADDKESDSPGQRRCSPDPLPTDPSSSLLLSRPLSGVGQC
ncbi:MULTISPECIES: hypothetical protein [unclassified Kocuria]|uniref:hypothetical protein n=1 Tax=unclassified Kocuria TaxID=2649579 RepID=UPI001293FF66|nr:MULTISPECIES: hypothetical protein [unclassified Kocuria]